MFIQALCDILILVGSEGYSVLSLENEQGNNQPEDSNQPGGSNESDKAKKNDQSETGESSCKKSRMDQELFHSKLRYKLHIISISMFYATCVIFSIFLIVKLDCIKHFNIELFTCLTSQKIIS